MRSVPRTTIRSRSLIPAGNDHTACIEGKYADRPRLEAFRRGVLPDDVLAIVASDDGVARKDQAGHRGATLNHHGQGLADVQPRRRLRNGEMNDGRVLPQRAARSEERQRNRRPDVPDCRCFAGSVRTDVVIGQRLDPEALRIGDLEQNVLWLDDLARHDLGRGDDAVGRRAQHLEAGPGIPRGLTARPQSLEFAFEIVDLTLRHRAPVRQWSQPSQLVLGHRQSVVRFRRPFRGWWCGPRSADTVRSGRECRPC